MPRGRAGGESVAFSAGPVPSADFEASEDASPWTARRRKAPSSEAWSVAQDTESGPGYDRCQGLCAALYRRPSKGHWIIDSNLTAFGVAFAIVMNIIFLGASLFDDDNGFVAWRPLPETLILYLIMDAVFLLGFFAELCIRIVARGATIVWDFWAYVDFLFLGASILELGLFIECCVAGEDLPGASVGRTIRTLRLFMFMRIGRLLSHFGLEQGVLRALRLLAVFAAVLFVEALSCGLAFTKLVGRAPDEQSQVYFGTVGRSMLTFMSMATLQDWPEIARNLWFDVAGGPWLALLLVVFVVVTATALLNILVAVMGFPAPVPQEAAQASPLAYASRELPGGCGEPERPLTLEEVEEALTEKAMKDGRLGAEEFTAAIEALGERLEKPIVDTKVLFACASLGNDAAVSVGDGAEAVFCHQFGGPCVMRLLRGHLESQRRLDQLAEGQARLLELAQRPQAAAPATAATAAGGPQQLPPPHEYLQQLCQFTVTQMREQVQAAVATEVKLAADGVAQRLREELRQQGEQLHGRLEATLQHQVAGPSRACAEAAAALERTAGEQRPRLEALGRALPALEQALHSLRAAEPAPAALGPPQPRTEQEDPPQKLAASITASEPIVMSPLADDRFVGPSTPSAAAQVYQDGLRRQHSPDAHPAAGGPAASPQSARLASAAELARSALRFADQTWTPLALSGGLERSGRRSQSLGRSGQLRGSRGGTPRGETPRGLPIGGFAAATLRPSSLPPAAQQRGAPQEPIAGPSRYVATPREPLVRDLSQVAAAWPQEQAAPVPPAQSAAAEAVGAGAGSWTGGAAQSSERIAQLRRWLENEGLLREPFDKLVFRLHGRGIELTEQEQDELKASLQR